MAISRANWTGTADFIFANQTVAGTTIGTAPSTETILAGDTIVVAVACDNLGATTPTKTLTIPANFDSLVEHVDVARNASAAAGTALGLWTCRAVIDDPNSGGGGSFSCALSGSVGARVIGLIALRGTAGGVRGTVQVANGSSTAPSVVSDVAVNGDVVIGVAALEQNSAPTGDSDTTDGSWSTLDSHNTTGGGSAANQSLAMQTKVVTADGAQTYNLTSANTDWIIAALILTPIPARPTRRQFQVGRSRENFRASHL